MIANKTSFTCPKCGYEDSRFHLVCPEGQRPFIRDFPDTQFHPRDPDPTGIYSGTFWDWAFLVFTLLGLAFYLLASFGII